MTTTRPRPPSIESSIDADPLIPLHHSDALYYVVGPPGADASGNGADAENPSPRATSLASLEPFIGTDGITRTAVEAIFDQVDTNVVVALTPANPTQAQVISTLQKVRRLTDRPTHLYPPGQTVLGARIGMPAAAINDSVTTLTLAAAAINMVEEGEILRIENELLRVTDVTSQTVFTVDRGAYGTTAAAHANTAPVTDLHSPVATELIQLVDELDCDSVADAPRISVQGAIQWANAGNVGPGVMGVFNRGDNNWPGGFWLGAAADRAAEHGRARGIEHAPVKGISSLDYELSHSPRSTVDTDVSNLVGAYLSTLVRRRGRVEIVGDTYKGLDDARKTWS